MEKRIIDTDATLLFINSTEELFGEFLKAAVEVALRLGSEDVVGLRHSTECSEETFYSVHARFENSKIRDEFLKRFFKEIAPIAKRENAKMKDVTVLVSRGISFPAWAGENRLLVQRHG
jgi:hypothetical protein